MADTLELTEETTKEEMQSLVDKLAEPAADEEKSDAQITSEHADNEKPTEDTAEEGAEAPSDSETGDEPDDSWRKAAKKDAAAYGIGEKELAEFQSREELDRALKLFDRNLDSERKKVRDGKEPKEPEEAKKPPAEPEKKPAGAYQVGLSKDIYDDKIVDEFNAMRDYYESRMTALEQRFKDADAAAEEERFDRSVDRLEFSQLFGKTGEETDAEIEKRKELFEHVQIEQEVLTRLGRRVDYDALVQRVARALHSEEYDKKLIKNHTRKISRQSDKRQGGGATRPTDPPEEPRDFADRLYKEMVGA